jgi:hypothetical protein
VTKSFKIQSLLQKQVLILDGATGTELQKKGLPSGVCPEIWCLENPALLADVHVSYVSAGAQVVYTCTFGANRFKLGQFGVKKDVYAVNRELALLARKACGKKALVAGDIGPTGLFIEPFGPLAFEEAVAAFKEQARGLIDGGCDMLVIETMIDIQEARAALVAVKELADIFTLVSMTYEPDGHTLGGTPPAAALVTLQSLGAKPSAATAPPAPNKWWISSPRCGLTRPCRSWPSPTPGCPGLRATGPCLTWTRRRLPPSPKSWRRRARRSWAAAAAPRRTIYPRWPARSEKENRPGPAARRWRRSVQRAGFVNSISANRFL